MMPRLFPLVFALAVFLISQGRPAAAASVCFDCHDRAGFSGSSVHQPVASGDCVACHNPHVAKYEGLFQQEAAELCYGCHSETRERFAKGEVHEPVRQGQCLSCHAAHASDAKGLLRGKLMESCLGCHTNLGKQYKVMHQPYARGQCAACHEPHNAGNIGLLRKESTAALCSSCHSRESITAGHKNFPQEPKNCLSCHNPHGSDRKGLVRNVLHDPYSKGCGSCHKGGRVSSDICLGCHQKVEEAARSLHNHMMGSAGNACVACHSPHAGDTKMMLRGSMNVVCRTCHEDTFRRHAPMEFKHRSSAGTCEKCHAVHGSNQVAMMKGDGNAICSQCHESQGEFSHPVGDKVRDPRNGQMMTCSSCHNPHGTEFKGLMRLSGVRDMCVQCHRY